MSPQLPESPNPATSHGALPQDEFAPLDHILLDDAILPSSGFAASVMDAIAASEAQKLAPAPIPFPWKLALPTLAAILIAIIGFVRYLTQLRQAAATHPDLARIDLSVLSRLTINPTVHYSLVAAATIAGALLCLLLTRFLAPGSSTR